MRWGDGAMALAWVSKGWALHLAERAFGGHGMLHASVTNLGETGWHWHVWDAAHHLRLRQGEAPTLAEAKAQAERAAAGMTERLLRPV